jgi:importin subunit beta-1
VANAVAVIASIEIPRREWLELIPNLCTNARHENPDYRNSSLQTLGYLCDELAPEDLIDSLKNEIVSALTSNITSVAANEKSTHLAVKAFFQALPFAHQNFQKQAERDYIMKQLFEAFLVQDEDTKFIAMQTLVEIARQEYESVQFYFDQLLHITSSAALGQDEKLGSQGIEFWTSLAEEEASRRKRQLPVQDYIRRCSSQLVKLLIACIQRVNIEDEEDEDDELGVALSSGCCLNAVALVIGNDIMAPIIEFVSQNITNQNWKQRYSALIALGAITEGPEKMQFMSIIMPGFQNLLQLF